MVPQTFTSDDSLTRVLRALGRIDPRPRPPGLTSDRRAGQSGEPLATGADQAPRQGTHRPPDLVLLDLGRSDLHSIEVICTLRKWTEAPIIVLSGRADGTGAAEATPAGSGDDRNTSLRVAEPPARARPVSGRTARDGDAPRVRIGDVVVDLAAKRIIPQQRQADATGQTADIRLTPTEWRLLEVLLRHPGQLLSRQLLLAEAWGPDYARATGNLRLFMAQLRRKREPDPARPRWLVTEPGMGYRFQPGPAGE